MRWSVTVDAVSSIAGPMDIMVWFDTDERSGGAVLVPRASCDAGEYSSCRIAPAQFAELLRGMQMCPMDLIDAMAADDQRRRAGGV